jgi:hypothetical protein
MHIYIYNIHTTYTHTQHSKQWKTTTHLIRHAQKEPIYVMQIPTCILHTPSKPWYTWFVMFTKNLRNKKTSSSQHRAVYYRACKCYKRALCGCVHTWRFLWSMTTFSPLLEVKTVCKQEKKDPRSSCMLTLDACVYMCMLGSMHVCM